MSGSSPVVVRYWAAAKAAVGAPEETYAAPGSLAALLDAIRERHGSASRLAEVLGRCSYLVDEVSPGRRPHADVVVPAGAVVDVLPPFAGGSSDDAAGRSGTTVGRNLLARP
jgi:molybdopterin converting factor small subunit